MRATARVSSNSVAMCRSERAGQLTARRADLLLLGVHVLHQRLEVHLAVAAHAGQLGGALDLRADAFQHELLLDERETLVLARVRDVAVVDHAVPEREHGVLAPRRVVHPPRVREDRPLDLQIGRVEDPHAIHHVRGTIDTVREDPILSQTGRIDDPFLLQDDRRLGPLDLHHQLAEPVVALGEHVVVEPERDEGERQGGAHGGSQKLVEPDPVGLNGRDLVVAGEAAERGHRGHQHGHGDRDRHRQRYRQHEHFHDQVRAEPLAGQILELPRHLVHQHDEREDGQGEDEGTEVLAKCVRGEGPRAEQLPPAAHRGEPAGGVPVPEVLTACLRGGETYIQALSASSPIPNPERRLRSFEVGKSQAKLTPVRDRHKRISTFPFTPE